MTPSRKAATASSPTPCSTSRSRSTRSAPPSTPSPRLAEPRDARLQLRLAERLSRLRHPDAARTGSRERAGCRPRRGHDGHTWEPGAEARRALRAGLHVMLFSDNVPVEQEIELKRLARERGLMLMGPDCGTAIVNGVPLGFANVVSRGRIGIAAASGTGAQEVMSTIARCGEGVSHVIGVGGRDLSDAVGGLAMEQAIDALAADPATSVVCVIGKPPGGTVARRLESQIARLGKPCALHFVGSTTASLEDCARDAVALARGEKHQPVAFTIPDAEVAHMVSESRRGRRPEQRFVRGVYSGGTLAWEARSVLDTTLGDVASVTGTDADPQNRSAQVSRLRGAGVVVMPSNAQAARLAARIAAR